MYCEFLYVVSWSPFIFRSALSSLLWVRLFVFIFLYFVTWHLLFQICFVFVTVSSSACLYIPVFCNLAPFISDLLCLRYCEFVCLYILVFCNLAPFISDLLCLCYCEFVCLYIPVFCNLVPFISDLLWLVHCGLVCLYIPVFCNLVPFISDLLWLVYFGLVCVCFYSCILQLGTFYFRSVVACVLWARLCVFLFLYFVTWHLLFQICCGLCTVDSSVCVFILVICIFIIFYFIFSLSCIL